MRLGNFFVEIGIQPNKKNIQAIQESIEKLEELRQNIKDEIDLEKELSQA